jgi:uncharacterized membrane protein YdfJ with MMPL/SSD domain
MSAKALTTRSPSGGASGPVRAERLGEAQPFGAIVVAMLEQMLGELDLGPAARAGLGSRTIAPRSSPPAARDQQRRDQSTPEPRSAVASIAITAK